MKEDKDKLNMPEDEELSFHKNNGKKFYSAEDRISML